MKMDLWFLLKNTIWKEVIAVKITACIVHIKPKGKKKCPIPNKFYDFMIKFLEVVWYFAK
jgi:hypothetical protein